MSKTFDEAFASIPGNGWLSREEAELLWRVAQEVPADRAILEVGVFEGRSTCLLAETGRTVYCVDPFAGFSTEDPGGTATHKNWLANVTGRGYDVSDRTPPLSHHLPSARSGFIFITDMEVGGKGLVHLYRQKIEDWSPIPVDLAYLDGDHTYAGTRVQVQKALLCNPKVICAHDVNDSGGGVEVKRACLELLGPWDERAERLAMWNLYERLKERTGP